MRFLTTGDFVFPFNFKTYLTEQFYLWSYNSGVPNLDETIRFFIRLPNLLVYALTGSNLAVSYFYIGFVFLVCFFSFKYFCNKFIGLYDRSTVIAVSLLYAINPIFLGNYAKIGLVLAATMMPLLLTFVKMFFLHNKFRYLLLIILALNISFIHPFCLTVNLVLTAGYFLNLSLKNRQIIRTGGMKLFAAGLVFILLNSYIILSVIALGSIDKSLLSQNLSDIDLNSANLINIANTGDILTAFSFSKNVFLDFRFYEGWYGFLYFAGMFILLALLIGIFIYSYYKLTNRYKKYLLLSLSFFLLLLLFTTGTFIGVDNLMTLLLKLPGGWAFRSPLKWQLYMPLFICAALVLLLDTISGGLRRYALMVGAVAFVLINGFIAQDVFRKLLIPRSSLNFSSSASAGTDRALLVKDDICNQYFLEDFSLLSNIRESYASKSVQLKEVDQEDLHKLNVTNYAEVLSCSIPPEGSLVGFSKASTVKAGSSRDLLIFENENKKDKVYLTNLISADPDSGNRAVKNSVLKSPSLGMFDYVAANEDVKKQGSIVELFENISGQMTHDGAIKQELKSDGSSDDYKLKVNEKVFYKFDDSSGELKLYGQETPDTTVLNDELILPADFVSHGSISYNDNRYRFNNLVDNGSLENGLWQDSVSDCFNFDDNPQIDMNLTNAEHTDGERSIKLEAGRHIACTGPKEFSIIGDETYLIYFDYKTSGNTGSRYNLLTSGFDVASSLTQLPATNGTWKAYSRIVGVPHGMSSMKLTFYGIPSVKSGRTETYFDNVRVVKVPRIAGKYFIVGSSSPQTSGAELRYWHDNPTRTRVSITQAKGVATIVLNDSFHTGWKLISSSNDSLSVKHFAVNNYENGWQIDVDSYCSQAGVCSVNSDGTYNLDFTIEFTPQRWFVIGLSISGMTFSVIILYLFWVYFSNRQNPIPKKRLVYNAR